MMKNLLVFFFTLLLFAAAATTVQAAKPKLAVFVVGIDDWKRGDVIAHIGGEELNRDKTYQVVTRSGAVQAKLKALRRTSWYADGCDIRKWGQQHGVEHICLITTPNDRNFLARLIDINNAKVKRSGGVLGEGMGAVQLKELSWVLVGKLRSSALVADVPCMVYVKGGTFTMGFLPGRDDANGNSATDKDLPAREGVEVEDFWMGVHAITQKEWLAVMGTLPSNISGNLRGDNKPVVYVSWNDIQYKYLTKLNESMVNTGMVYKLPTEAQWEYAARGGVKMYDRCEKGCVYSGSNNVDDVAVYGYSKASNALAAVKTKLPNELGIYDMCGNVFEKCEDGWRTNYDDVPDILKPAVRGGSWYSGRDNCRIVTRNYDPFSAIYLDVGFRVV
jgi:formylglycine-generating enzyme required for sulfatase activity